MAVLDFFVLFYIHIVNSLILSLSMALLSNLYCQVWCFTVPVEALRIPFIPKTISGIPQIPITSPFTGDYNSLRQKRGNHPTWPNDTKQN